MGDSSSSSSFDPTSESEEFLMIKEFIEDPDAVPKSREFLKEVLKEVITDPEVVSKCRQGLRDVMKREVISPLVERMKVGGEEAKGLGKQMAKEMNNLSSSIQTFSAVVTIISVMATGVCVFKSLKSSPRAAASAASFLSRPLSPSASASH